MSEWRTWSKEKHFFCFIPRSLDKKNINFHIYIYIEGKYELLLFLPMKGIVNFKITILNRGPSTCRNGERDQKKSISFVLFPEALIRKI